MRAAEDFYRKRGDNRGQANRIVRRAFGGVYQKRGDLILSDIGEVRVEQRREPLHEPLIHRKRKMHELAFDGIVAEHQDDNKGVCVNINEVDALYRHGCARCERERRVIGELRGEAAYIADRIVKLLQALIHAAVYILRLLSAELLPLHKLVHVHPVPFRCRDTSG